MERICRIISGPPAHISEKDVRAIKNDKNFDHVQAIKDVTEKFVENVNKDLAEYINKESVEDNINGYLPAYYRLHKDLYNHKY